MRVRGVALAFVVGLLATLNTTGQPNPVTPTHLAIEVYFYESEPPSYVAVPAANAPPSGTWFARFQRVPGWTPPVESLQVTAVNFRPVMDRDAVRVSVTVFLGPHLKEEARVGVFTLREGEKIRIQELTQFGVESVHNPQHHTLQIMSLGHAQQHGMIG